MNFKHVYKKFSIFALATMVPMVAFLFAVSLLLKPAQVHAGFLSIFSNPLETQASAAQVDTSATNSQNMPLLQAAINIDPNPYQGKSDPVIVSNGALLPEVGPAGTIADIESGAGSNQISSYIVQDGDTLSKIATMFHVSVNTIIWANDLQKSPIKEGQTLVILPITGIQYTIKSGDTIQSIVKKYGADLADVLDYNNLATDSALKIGDVILIPDIDAAPTPVVKIPSNAASNPTSPLRNANGPSYPGYYAAPIAPGHYHRSQGLHGNNAVDLAAPIGTPIIAAANGVVIVSVVGGWNGGYGSYVVIAHPNGTQTLYGHTSGNFVKVGDHVVQGQHIANVGQTGKATGPHVHFEVRGAKNPF